MIGIIDYDAGNINSVQKALDFICEEYVLTKDAKTLLSADKVILPGVGSFGMAMDTIRKYELDKVIYEIVDKQTPFIGVCLGLQLMFEGSDESQGVEGLNLLKGKIKKIPKTGDLKIPHMGWNSLELVNDGRLFRNLPANPYVYFVHSYYLEAEDYNIVKATSEYGVTIHASVEKDNLFGCQFHPEKSSDVGLQILKNFCEI